MDLRLDRSLGATYASGSQVARRLTEPWAERNLYCPACPSDGLSRLPENTAVFDFECARCGAGYQLKSKKNAFGRKVSNSAYADKVAAIASGRAPHHAFLRYDSEAWEVRDLFVIPGHFFTPAVVERRKPLGPEARRPGWVGSNILLHALPGDARVDIVVGGRARAPADVREDWRRFAFLERGARGGWSADVLACVRRFQRERGDAFSVAEFHAAFGAELARRHPANRHVRAKVRQQLQLLRDGGVLASAGRGQYRIHGPGRRPG